MKIIKKISCYFDRVTFEIRTIKRKRALIFMCVFLALGVLSWLLGGKTDRVMLLYQFPRMAIGIGFMFFLWAISFVFCGFIFSGIMFSGERYRRHVSYKISMYLLLMQLFTFTVYPLFFCAVAPFLTLVSLLIAMFFCFLFIVTSLRYYSLWTICMILHMIWLTYNAYVTLAFIIIN